MVKSYGKIIRAHDDFNEVLKEINRKTGLSRMKITQNFAKEYRRKCSKPVTKINNWPFKGKLKIGTE